jgi:putative Mg2+ transporter-C (MgtC) family protein
MHRLPPSVRGWHGDCPSFAEAMDSFPLDMDSPLTIVDAALRLSLASVLGAAVGWEREVQRKAAGLRTHMMVAMGSAVFTLTALEMMQLSASETGGPGDATRVVQGIVGGIGFLGAGQIIQSRGAVEGVTTAAGIWVVGAVGVACGGGAYLLAVLAVLFSLFILRGVAFVEARLTNDEGRNE